MPENETGTLYGVGLGPGDPELLTLKARRVIGQAAVIFTPMASPGAESYALKIIAGFIDESRQEIVPLLFPMTRDAARLKDSREAAAAEIYRHLRGGRDGAFITEGDPMLYSTFSYVLDIFAASYPEVDIEVVPGITSMTAAAAALKKPLTRQGDILTIYPAGYDDNRLEQVLDASDTVAIYKTYRDKERILALLEEKGLAGRTVFAANVGRPGERLAKNLTDIAGEDIDYFSLLIVEQSET